MIIEGKIAVLAQPNIDTDQIIPARYLTGIDSSGLGIHALEGLHGAREILAARADASIIVAGENFGCGSSREHAVWALWDRGFRAVIAPSFGRIFEENAYHNGLAVVAVLGEVVDALAALESVRIDVSRQLLFGSGPEPISFDLDPLRKTFLVGGGYLRYLRAKIGAVRRWEAGKRTPSRTPGPLAGSTPS
jgi:3-isopropylmalate/(R)-2-methylmalate dehydratase small subunit